MMDVLGFEPYDDGSHRSIRELISRHSRHRWTWLTRPARGWKWRMRLAAAEMVDDAARSGQLERGIDLIFATSLLSTADLRALLPKRLRGVPIALYMHENQAAYPLSGHPKVDPGRDVHFAITNLTSAMTADVVIWNSRHNMDSFLAGMSAILRRANAVDLSGWAERIESRSLVIWPPVEAPPGDLPGRALDGAIRVAWPHRWEHDKGPQELLEIAGRLSDKLNLRWTILGWRFPAVPPELAEFERRFAARIDHMGFEPDRRCYWEHLARCDWVLSTARHEYFGVAVVEALLAGCLPWLPQRLSYVELLPDAARGLSPAAPPADRNEIVAQIRAHLQPALAPNAVARLDVALDRAVAGLEAAEPRSSKSVGSGERNASDESRGNGRSSP